MRRRLIATVAAVVAMVLLAMLVPMAVLVQSYALEDRLSRAALEVQATETVVSGAGEDKGTVAVYLERLNRQDDVKTTVLYPDGTAIGPNPSVDDRIREARRTGQARVDDVSGGAQILVPVSLGGSSTTPAQTPVIRVDVLDSGATDEIYRAWLLLAGLGVVLLVGAVFLADRLGRSFTEPIRALAGQAQQLGERSASKPVGLEGPPEVRELGTALNRLVGRIEVLLERERQVVSDLSHRLRTPITALRLRIDGIEDPAERARLTEDVDHLESMVDHVVREGRRSEREGLVSEAGDGVAALAERIRFWEPLAEDQGREFSLDLPDGAIPVRASRDDLLALVDVLLDNVFSHTPDGAPVAVTIAEVGDGLELVVEDGGPGFPEGLDPARRGTSGAGSSGLGLSIAERTAAQSGGELEVSRSRLGGALVRVVLGPPG